LASDWRCFAAEEETGFCAMSSRLLRCFMATELMTSWTMRCTSPPCCCFADSTVQCSFCLEGAAKKPHVSAGEECKHSSVPHSSGACGAGLVTRSERMLQTKLFLNPLLPPRLKWMFGAETSGFVSTALSRSLWLKQFLANAGLCPVLSSPSLFLGRSATVL